MVGSLSMSRSPSVTTSYPGSTHAVPGASRAAGIGKRSLVALAGLIGAVTLVSGLGAVTASVAAAAVPSYTWAIRGGGTGTDFATGVSALPDGSSIITGYFNGTATFGTTPPLISTGSLDIFTAKVNADGSYAWAVRAGGTDTARAFGVSALADGSSIITGFFSGTATFGATNLTSTGLDDTFTAKVNADGSYAWATKGGGPGADQALGVSALADGSSIISGVFAGSATFGATSLTSAGLADTFTAKVNADGSYAWATQGGGTGNAIVFGVSALADGSSIITGFFIGLVAFGATSFTSDAGSLDTFTAKVNADGSYAWAIQGGGSGFAISSGVSALADGSSIITGFFIGLVAFGATSFTSAGLADTFTAKVNADGSYAWVTQGGGPGDDAASGVSALADGSSIISGTFSGSATFGTTDLISAGSNDTFTAKVNANGSYAWAIKAGGAGYDAASDVSALADGSSIISGSFNGSATFFGVPSLISTGESDTFTARILADVPQAPTGASASAGIQEATITWNAVAGGSVSSYTATAAPGGASCTAVAPATTCTITGLTAGTSYTATVTATSPHGTSPASQASNAVTPTAVALPPTAPVNTFTIKSLKGGTRTITTQLNLPGPGKVKQVGTTKLTRKARTTIVCTARKTVAAAGKVTITCRLSAKARAARKKHSLKLRLVTTFTPTGGTAKSVSKTLILKKTR